MGRGVERAVRLSFGLEALKQILLGEEYALSQHVFDERSRRVGLRQA